MKIPIPPNMRLLILCLLFAVGYSTIGGAAGGDLQGTYPNPLLEIFGPGAIGPIGNTTHCAIVSVDGTGRVQSLSAVAVAATPSGAAGGVLSGFYPNVTLAPIIAPGTYYNPNIKARADGRVDTISSELNGEYAMSASSLVVTNAATNWIIVFDTLNRANGWVVSDRTFSPLPSYAGLYMITLNVYVSTPVYVQVFIKVTTNVIFSELQQIPSGGYSYSLGVPVYVGSTDTVEFYAEKANASPGDFLFLGSAPQSLNFVITSMRIP